MLVKLEEETDPSYGCPPLKRPIDQHVRFGLVNLDKPSGPSSHEVVAWVKRMLGLKHAGHGGTLETRPRSEQSNGHRRTALALEEATKTIQAFLLTGKEYTCIMTLHGDVGLAR